MFFVSLFLYNFKKHSILNNVVNMTFPNAKTPSKSDAMKKCLTINEIVFRTMRKRIKLSNDEFVTNFHIRN